jgi:Leucine-rich repeat (LRR) protein
MLTRELIFSRNSKISDLSEITKLNIYAEDIEDISIISSMPKLEYLSLSSNNISSLSALSDCIYLREIYLRNNNISSFEELNHLRHLFNLKVLWLEGNPICDDDFYRKKVLNILPQIISLDNKSRILKRERANVKVRNQSEQKRARNGLDFNLKNISKSQRKKILMRRVFSYYNDEDDRTEKKEVETLNNISLKHNNIKYNNYIYSNKKTDLSELKIRFNAKMHFNQKENDKNKKIYRKLKLKLKTEENKNNNIHIHNIFNNINQMPKIGDNNITVQNSIPTEGKYNFFRNVNKDKKHINNCFGNNNYVMKAIYLLVDKMNVNDLLSLKKVINNRISVLGKVN